MIKDIANKHGLAVARTASEKTKRLSTVIKELLNERICHTSLLGILIALDIIECCAHNEENNLADVFKQIYEQGKSNTARYDVKILVAKSGSSIGVVVSRYSSFADLQDATIKKIRHDEMAFAEFADVFEGITHDDVEEIDINS